MHLVCPAGQGLNIPCDPVLRECVAAVVPITDGCGEQIAEDGCSPSEENLFRADRIAALRKCRIQAVKAIPRVSDRCPDQFRTEAVIEVNAEEEG